MDIDLFLDKFDVIFRIVLFLIIGIYFMNKGIRDFGKINKSNQWTKTKGVILVKPFLGKTPEKRHQFILTREYLITLYKYVDIFSKMPITSPALSAIGNLIASENYQPLFPIDLVTKDLQYTENIASQTGAKTPFIAKIREIYQQGQQAGYGQNNINGIIQIYLN